VQVEDVDVAVVVDAVEGDVADANGHVVSVTSGGQTR
jgi:hypothetical protein